MALSRNPYGSSSKSTSAPGLTEFEILKASHKLEILSYFYTFHLLGTIRFLRDSDEAKSSSWNELLAAKYYANLYREFAVCDLKHYKSGNVCLSPSHLLSWVAYLVIHSLHCAGEQKPKCFQGPGKRRAGIRVVTAIIPLDPQHLSSLPWSSRSRTRSTGKTSQLWSKLFYVVNVSKSSCGSGRKRKKREWNEGCQATRSLRFRTSKLTNTEKHDATVTTTRRHMCGNVIRVLVRHGANQRLKQLPLYSNALQLDS